MSAQAVRSGQSAIPTVAVAGVINTTARHLRFLENGRPIYVRPCLVTNIDADTAFFVLVNADQTGAGDTASLTLFDFRVGPGATVDVTLGGRIAVESLSIFMPTGVSAVTDAVVSGWLPC